MATTHQTTSHDLTARTDDVDAIQAALDVLTEQGREWTLTQYVADVAFAGDRSAALAALNVLADRMLVEYRPATRGWGLFDWRASREAQAASDRVRGQAPADVDELKEVLDQVRAERARAAEYHVLETFDIRRVALGHDYGCGQRTSELNRRLKELSIEEIDLVQAARDGHEFTREELQRAWTKVAHPKIRRIEHEDYRRSTPATQRTLEAWHRTRRLLLPPPAAGGSPELDVDVEQAIAGGMAAIQSPPAPLILVTTGHPTLHQHPGPKGEPVHPRLGRLLQPRHLSSVEKTAAAGIPWAADNDCFQGLDQRAFVRMIDRLEGLDGCLFVTVPDVVADSAATLESFERWAPELERRGLPLGFVLQDGQTADQVPWDRIAAVFVGGSDDFKLGPAAAELARVARARGKWVHWGRVNSRKRFDLIVATGAADSFDGSKWARFRKTYLDGGLAWCQEALERTIAAGVAATRAPAPVAGGSPELQEVDELEQLADAIDRMPAATAADQAARFNARIDLQTRAAVRDGESCCGADYWTEGDHHDPDCPAALKASSQRARVERELAAIAERTRVGQRLGRDDVDQDLLEQLLEA